MRKLVQHLDTFVTRYNRTAAPFRWTATADSILAKLSRIAKAINATPLQHGQAIRWARWGDDARLQDGDGLTTWLTEQGVHPTLLDLLYQNPLALEGGQIDGWGGNVLSPAEQRVLLGEIRYRQGHMDAALAEWDAVLTDYPALTKAYALRGDALGSPRTEGCRTAASSDADRIITAHHQDHQSGRGVTHP